MQEIEPQESQETKPAYTLKVNPEFLGFKKVEVTEIDNTKPWKPPKKVRVTKEDGSIVENLDAETPFFIFQDPEGNQIIVDAVAAGHINEVHIQGKDPGSKFEYKSLEELFKAIAEKLPSGIATESGTSAIEIEMGKKVGKEGIATLEELEKDGILTAKDLEAIEKVKSRVYELNKSGDESAKKAFIEEFKEKHPDCKVQFQLVRGGVIVPVVRAEKRETTKLFMVFGPGDKYNKILYTISPGRYMPPLPDPKRFTTEQGTLDEKSFRESADAWLNTAMLVEE